MGDVHVIGAAMTRFGKFMDRSVRSLAEEAVRDALDDASVAPGEVDIAFFSNAVAGVLTGQEMIRGQVALRHTGLLGIPIVNVENACASASTAFYLAWMAVASGTAEVALAVGAEKLTHPDKARSFAAIGTAVDLEQLGDLERQMAHRAGGGSPGEAGGGRSFFMDVYASTTQAYMERGGATAEDFAQVSVKNHHHGALNPKAQYREEVTLEQVLGGRRIAGPLTLLMCSPIGDGAAALVLCSEERARRRSEAAGQRRYRPGRADAGEPQRRPAVEGASDRRDRMRPARRACRPAPRPVRRPAGGGGPDRPRRERRRVPRQRPCRHGRDDRIQVATGVAGRRTVRADERRARWSSSESSARDAPSGSSSRGSRWSERRSR